MMDFHLEYFTMTLKEQLIEKIDQMPPEHLILLEHLIRALGRRTGISKTKGSDYIQVRKALATCSGNLSDEIISDRSDRV